MSTENLMYPPIVTNEGVFKYPSYAASFVVMVPRFGVTQWSSNIDPNWNQPKPASNGYLTYTLEGGSTTP